MTSETSEDSPSFDTEWEARYRDNPEYRNKYPFTSVVVFVFKNRPKDRPADETSVLEVGCGNGNNLWFAAREGFRVAGIDGSATAVGYANEWFEREGLQGDLRVGDFTELPWDDESFDLVVDRGSLSLCGYEAAERAVSEVSRVLRPGGHFMFTPYSDRCSSFDGLPDADGCYRDIKAGVCLPGTQIRFYGLHEVRALLRTGWRIVTLEHQEYARFEEPERVVHAEWFVVSEKTGPAS